MMVQLVLMGMSVLCAGVPMLLFLAIVWWLDRYDREPVWLLVSTFAWGALGAVPLAIVVGAIAEAIAQAAAQALDATLVVDLSPWAAAMSPTLIAPMVEEPAKAAVLLAVIFNRNFDNMTDGFVYGAAAGLGFGMTENLLYFVGTTSNVVAWGGTVFVRTFYSAVMHATATSIVGAALGYGRFRGAGRMLFAGAVGMLGAMGIHALWNGLISLGEVGLTTDLFWLDLVLFPVEVFIVGVVFEVCVLDESRTIRAELEEEAAAGHLPAEHPRILASWIRRLSGSWLEPGIDRDDYVQLCTDLAMRKRQLRQLGARSPRFYRDEVARLRSQLITVSRREPPPHPGRTT
ncbi:MAG: RsiW-degrading membrane proteinase PrsW (M82 family) [Myxococcota bacterium]|jgi:RsiW-degrading membrane proteinase PrsW (M82 family)